MAAAPITEAPITEGAVGREPQLACEEHAIFRSPKPIEVR